MIPIPYQPISFDTIDVTRNYNFEHTLLYNQTDAPQFQFKATEQADNLGGDGDFTATAGVFTGLCTYDGTLDLASATGVGSWSYTLTGMADLTYWRIRCDLDIVSGDVDIIIGGETVGTYADSQSVDDYFLVESSVGSTIQFSTNGNLTIDNVVVNLMTVPTLKIKDCDDNIDYTFTPSTYSNVSNRYFTSEDPGECIYYYYNEFIKVEVLFTGIGLADGQYYLNMDTLDSNSISLGTHPETALVTWRGETATDALGFSYKETGFIQSLRFKLELNKPRLIKQKINSKDSTGAKTIPFSEVDRVVTMTTDLLDDIQLMALGVGLEHDVFQIDSVTYINKETEFAPNWGSYFKASVSVDLERDEKLINSSC